MSKNQRTLIGDVLSSLMLDLFRFNSLLSASGDRLVAPIGLTSARWQIVGAIVNANRGQPVAWLARDLGTNRQNVQRIVNDLHRNGLVAFEANPHHRRAQLVVLTDQGRRAYEAAMALQAPWIDGLSEGLAIDDLKAVHRVITSLREKLEGDPTREKQI